METTGIACYARGALLPTFSSQHASTRLTALRSKSSSIISLSRKNLQQNLIPNKKTSNFSLSEHSQNGGLHIASTLGIPVGAFLTAVAEPAMALTGVNDEEDIIWVLTQLAISAFLYFLVCPPIIMNWLRVRWYRRNLLEMYVQFMFVFMFFPGLLLWAPFLNFRKFPRDPSMKYPWSIPEDPSSIKNDYLKYPWATPEDYDQP